MRCHRISTCWLFLRAALAFLFGAPAFGQDHDSNCSALLLEDEVSLLAVDQVLTTAALGRRGYGRGSVQARQPHHLDGSGHLQEQVTEQSFAPLRFFLRERILGRWQPFPLVHGRSNFYQPAPRKWRKSRAPDGHTSFERFITSATFYEWALFGIALTLFLALYLILLDWPSRRRYHGLALFIWIAVGLAYAFLIWGRLGSDSGIDWICGFAIELIFSIENIFIYHVIVEAWRTPRAQSQKALFVAICAQILIQAGFFMGLAEFLRDLMVLPYLLGAWLLYVAWASATSDEESQGDAKDTCIFRWATWCLGDRFSPEYVSSNAVFSTNKDGKLCVTLLFPTILAVLLVDVLMEVDVTITKIESFDNMYIAYTSSVAAGFCVPELFFVARDLFTLFPLMKYGVSFILAFFGVQLLLHQLVEIPDLAGIVIIVCVLLLTIVLSKLLGLGKDIDDETPPTTFRNFSPALSRPPTTTTNAPWMPRVPEKPETANSSA